MENNTLYQLALSRIKGIGPVHTKKLIEHFGDAPSIFHSNRTALERTGLNAELVNSIVNLGDLSGLRRELQYLQRIGVRVIFFTEKEYPQRLLAYPNAPALLFYQGIADLNAAKIIAVAGTRSPSTYGRQMTAQIIRALARPDLLIVSGLAFGIDATAHDTAIKCHIPTIGVLGHGFDHIYPALHRGLYHAIRRQGALITSFHHETKPTTYTFPFRNQLVAGLCDALIVIESRAAGGSISAAEAAIKFQKKMFALPGRITDEKSAGCLRLIRDGHALALISTDQLKADLGWDRSAGRLSRQPTLPFAQPTQLPPSDSFSLQPPQPGPLDSVHPPQDDPFDSLQPPQPGPSDFAQPAQPDPTLSDRPNPAQSVDRDISRQTLETQLIDLLKREKMLSFEDIITLTHQPIPSLSVALLNLEISGAIQSLAGRRYRLVG